jgi:hypothetical protein
LRTSYLAALTLLSVARGVTAQTIADPDFDVSVAHPAYPGVHPRIVIDEAHNNFHTANGRYKPFADLLRNDGYVVTEGTSKFDRAFLESIEILVIANARGGDGPPLAANSAFSTQECSEMRTWIARGGKLLLIADHAPFGHAAHQLAARLGIEMGEGHVFDAAHSIGESSILVFSRENGLLPDNAITGGRNPSERITRVVAFEGQSLSLPANAIPLLTLGASARESSSVEQMEAAIGVRVGGRAQGLAVKIGRGRVVVMGEAAMFSAQLLKLPGQPDIRFGMNTPNTDDKQFVLNVLHWLSGAL